MVMALLALPISVFPSCIPRLWAFFRLPGLHHSTETFDGWLLSGLQRRSLTCQYGQVSLATSIPLATLCSMYVLEIVNLPLGLLTLYFRSSPTNYPIITYVR
jgi:hypothetical protein